MVYSHDSHDSTHGLRARGRSISVMTIRPKPRPRPIIFDSSPNRETTFSLQQHGAPLRGVRAQREQIKFAAPIVQRSVERGDHAAIRVVD
jgi:hypothetical protein